VRRGYDYSDPAAQGDSQLKHTIRSHGLKLSRWSFLLIAVLLSSIPVGSKQSAQSPQSSRSPGIVAKSAISVNTELVVLPVRVTDAHGTSVTGLRLEDFRVYENGRPQNVTLFQQEDAPVTVGLVVDHSRSMASKLKGVEVAVTAFAHLSNHQDEMFVVNFNDDVAVEAGEKSFTNDPMELEKAVGALSARGRTALYDAVAEGIEHLKLGHWDKKALVIVSDGGDNASQQKYSQVLALAQRSQTVIYSIGLMGEHNADENPGVLKRLCKNTGGIAYFPRSEQSVADISKQVAGDLRKQYTVGFVPETTDTTGAFRKIKVKVVGPGHDRMRAQTRLGYFGAQEKPPAAPPVKKPAAPIAN
jgi:Ca-activated chloride channel family protein